MIAYPVKRNISREFRQGLDDFSSRQTSVLHCHRKWCPTPLVNADRLAKELNVKQVLVKDEGNRNSLPAFKILGVSHAVERLNLSAGATVCTMTDGNHGLALASCARACHLRAVIFVPGNMTQERKNLILAQSATVIETNGTYDDAIAVMRAHAAQKGWFVVSDTSWPGYESIPADIVAGYGTMFREIEEQRRGKRPITHIFVQAGVGGLAAAAACWLSLNARSGSVWDPSVKLLVCEPSDAACLFENRGRTRDNLRMCSGQADSAMAGLNCGIPSYGAWPMVSGRADGFLLVEDEDAFKAMRMLSAAGIVSGESGAAGLAGLLRHRIALGIGKEAVVLLLNTESDTDKKAYRKIVHDSDIAK